MLKIGDYALHQTTGNQGKVIAYGHQILDGVYLPTLRVEMVTDMATRRRTFLEDVSQAWVLLEPEKN